MNFKTFSEQCLCSLLSILYRDRTPLVELRAVMREVVSSTPAGPTLRILK